MRCHFPLFFCHYAIGSYEDFRNFGVLYFGDRTVLPIKSSALWLLFLPCFSAPRAQPQRGCTTLFAVHKTARPRAERKVHGNNDADMRPVTATIHRGSVACATGQKDDITVDNTLYHVIEE